MAYRYIIGLTSKGLPNDAVKVLIHCRCGHIPVSRSIGNVPQALSSNIGNKYIHTSTHDTEPVSQYRGVTYKKLFKQTYYNYFKTNYVICDLPIRSISSPVSLCSVRFYHITPSLNKEESVVEKSVKALKEETSKKTEEESVKLQATKEPKKEVVPRKTIWQKIVAEVKHYYHGFRLLAIDVKVSSRLLWLLLNGKTLSRREHKQLIRTTADLFRLVPFLVFIIIPFMEFLLPVALKLFPNMLPSTFREEAREQEKIKKQLKVKLEMAKFLQDTIEESALQGSKKDMPMAEEFSEFVSKIRSKGIQVSTSEILKFSKLFEDEITLDNLSREQLMALCRVLSLPTIGTDMILRFQLRMKLRQLLTDDKMIHREGINSLTLWELQAACRARGMRALGMPETRLRFQLQQWLDLHLNEKIPTSLLLLSRALYLPEELSTTEQLTETISKLSDTATTEAKVKLSEMYGEKVDNKAKLEVIRQQEEAIKKENEAKKEEEEKEKQLELEMAEAVAAKTAMEVQESIADPSLVLEAQPGEELKDITESEEEKITIRDLSEIEVALEEIAEEKQFNIDKEELDDLKEDIEEYQEDLEDLRAVILASGGTEQDLKESKSAKRLAKRVNRIIQQLDERIEELHQEKDEIQTEIEVGEVKLRRSQELQQDEEKRKEMLKSLRAKRGNVISINELVLAMKRIQKVSDETRLQKIVQVLDEDRDGNIDVSHVLKVIELLGKENVMLNSSQVSDIIDLLKQEDVIDQEEKLKEKQEKEQKNNSASANSENKSEAI